MNLPDEELAQLSMDPNSLYREETYTDRRIGTIRAMTPVTADGVTDATKPVLYLGQTQVMTPAGALPISFEIDAESLGQAAEKFAEAAQTGIERTMKELEEMRREASSSILVPGQGGSGGMGGMPGGGMPGGGNIQMP